MAEERDFIEQCCRHCNSNNSLESVYCLDHESNDGCKEEYTLAKCLVCKDISFFYREDVQLIWLNFEESPDYYCLWPQEVRLLDCELPELISISYSEAVNALKSGLLVAAGAMIGRTLEAVCKDFDPKCTGIFKGLEYMLNKGALSKEMYEWANELRVLRNESAHATIAKITKHEVEYALDFLQSILELIYEIRPKFEKYKDSRSSKN